MSLTKNNIINNLKKSSLLSVGEASNIFESFLSLIKSKSKSRSIKLSGFGTFSFKKTPKRVGRNPKTKDSYIIPELNKLNFKSSNKVKEQIN
ncbi:HU family DNA-binding protein [Gammaproteobacteria bacterium]|nr:HU family DNA-binding protein [Gammaproteobacteria bacterium]